MTERTKTMKKTKEQSDQQEFTYKNWNQDIRKREIEKNYLAQQLS